MSTPIIPVAVLGTGPLSDLLAARIDARADLRSAGRITAAQPAPTETECVVYVPTVDETGGNPSTKVLRLLADGLDVVSALPVDGLAEIRDAARRGGSTFHATGGFPTQLAARITRALAEVTRDIRRVELEEELALPECGIHPWNNLEDTGIGTSTAARAKAAAAAVSGYYEAGLRVLEEAVFGERSEPEATLSIEAVTTDTGIVDTVIIERELGSRLSYRSTWTARAKDTAPLRYRLTTATGTARGTATVEFHDTAGTHPADHVTAVAVLDAIRPIHESAPGIAHRDLSITPLKPDPRLTLH